jgi:hypothetical protein
MALTMVRALPPAAGSALMSGGDWELKPSSPGSLESWAVEDDLWARYWFVPGWRVTRGSLLRTIWRFSDDGERSLVSELDVDDPDYMSIMSGYGEEARRESWRDYLRWVIANETDPLDILGIGGNGHKSVVTDWIVVVRPVVRGGREIGVELLGAKPVDSRAGFRSPDSFPLDLLRRLSGSTSLSSGEWFALGYGSVEELVRSIGAETLSRDDDSCRIVVSVREDGPAQTPRTEVLREAAREALERLSVAENPRRGRPRSRLAHRSRRRTWNTGLDPEPNAICHLCGAPCWLAPDLHDFLEPTCLVCSEARFRQAKDDFDAAFDESERRRFRDMD